MSSVKQEPNGDQILAMLWFSQKIEKSMKIIDKLTKLHENTPLLFIKSLNPSQVTAITPEILKLLLSNYNAPKWGICKWVSDYLKISSNPITTALSIAIGTEKASWNKEYYHKIRVLSGMEMGQWRKFLNEKRRGPEFITIEKQPIKKYSIGLFNEPVDLVTLNPSGMDVPIVTCYKKNITKNKHCRTPIELPLDIPFQQSDFHSFIAEKKAEPMVIITKNIGQDVIVPEGFYLLFVNDTESFGKGIYPYISNKNYCSRRNFFEMINL
jgi:hypothetical protein